MNDSDSEPWWTGFYDENLAAVLLDPAEGDEAERTAGFIEQVLGLEGSGRIFDQCCGTGRLSHALAARGYEVLGIDQAESYITRARETPLINGTPPRFETADAFAFVASPACDAVINWWTSFGYAADDDDNLRMLSTAFESLRPGGSIALDFMNAVQVYRNFQEEVISQRATPDGELKLTRSSRIDLATNTLHKVWCYELPDGGRIERPSAVRLYDPAALGRLLELAGFRQLRFFGDIDARPLELDSPRCIITARKP